MSAAIDLSTLDFSMLSAPGLLDFEPRECRIGLEETRYRVALERGRVEVQLVSFPGTRESAQGLVRWAIRTASGEVRGCTAAFSRKLQAALDEGCPLVWL